MKRLLTLVLLPALLLVSCADQAGSRGSRQAVLTDLVNDVRTRASADGILEPASLGQTLQVGGQAQSGDDSRARLDLAPEGTIIRIGPNTLFTLSALSADPATPSARLKLLLGQMWIILADGSLEVETDFGIGAVRGSYMSVEFDPLRGMRVTCLEGHCSLGNDAGAVDMTGGQASRITASGSPPETPFPVEDADLQAWLEMSPESQVVIQPGTAPAGGKPPPGGSSTGPTAYTLTNNCDDGVWHWRFDGPQVITLDIPSGETANGELPPGSYTAVDWFDDGPSHTSGPFPPGGSFSVRSCPEK